MVALTAVGQAARDADLLDRFVSAAAGEGIDQAEEWTRLNARKLVLAPVDQQGSTIAGVYEYQAEYRKQHPLPNSEFPSHQYLPIGVDPAAIGDNQIKAAVQQVLGQEP